MAEVGAAAGSKPVKSIISLASTHCLLIHTNLHTPEEVLAARKAAHEQQSVKPLINLLRLLFDQFDSLDIRKL